MTPAPAAERTPAETAAADPFARHSRRGEPAWELLDEEPVRGRWTERDYLALNTNRRIELVDGTLEFLPMPTGVHEDVAEFLYKTLDRFTESRGLGKAKYAGIRVRQYDGKYRFPDVQFMRAEHDHRRTNECWIGADLAVEVVSEDDPNRDLVEKRAEYARTGIPEYWIADPRDRSLTVLVLDDGADEYREAGRYGDGDVAPCVTLPGLTVDVTACFDAA